MSSGHSTQLQKNIPSSQKHIEYSPWYILFWITNQAFSSVQFSRSVVSDSLQPHESQHARPPCPSSTPRVHSNSRPSSWWCHPAISSVVPFSFCPQFLPASESFSISQPFAWGGQSTGVSALASFLPNKSQGWSPSEWTGWISLQSKGLWWAYMQSINRDTDIENKYMDTKRKNGEIGTDTMHNIDN